MTYVMRLRSWVFCLVAMTTAVHSETVPLWSEGDCTTQFSGANRTYFNRGAGQFWRNYLGDWQDKNGQLQGNEPFVSFNVPSIDKEQTFDLDVADIVSQWINGSMANKGFFIRRLNGGSFRIYSREYAQGERVATLTINTTDDTYTLKATTDTHLNKTTYKCLGNKTTLSTADNVLIYFDVDAAKISGEVLDATLTIHSDNKQYGSDSVHGLFVAAPEFRQYDIPLQEWGIAKDFPNDYNIASSPSVIMAASFDSLNWQDKWTFGHGKGDISLTTSNQGEKFSALAGNALQAKLKEGQLTAMSLNYMFKEETGVEPEDVYFRYYLRFGDSWETIDGGKLPGIAGIYDGKTYRGGWGGRTSTGNNGWSARGIFRKVLKQGNHLEGKVPVGTYLYHADMEGPYGDVLVWDGDGLGVFEKNRWYAIEQRIKLNTPGKNDGLFQVWIDGKPAYQIDNLKLRNEGKDFIKIERIWMNIYHGGTKPNNKDVYAFVDNVVIAREYIGPSYFNAKLPSAGSEPNAPPVVENETPVEHQIRANIGDELTFSAEITDPEGSDIDVKWYLDDKVVASGVNAFSYRIDLDAKDNNLVHVTVSDSQGLTTEREWEVIVNRGSIEAYPVIEDTYLTSSTYKAQGYLPQLSSSGPMYFKVNVDTDNPNPVVSAQLRLFDYKQYGDVTFKVYQGPEYWYQGTSLKEGATRSHAKKEDDLKWNNYMGDWQDIGGNDNGEKYFSSGFYEDTDKERFILLDVTKLLQARDGDYSTPLNIVVKGSGGNHRFYSTEHSDADKHPKLFLSYKEDISIPAPVTPAPPPPTDPEPEPVVVKTGSSLPKLASDLNEGEWGELSTKGFTKGLTRVLYEDKYFHIAGWTDDAMWDTEAERLLFMGFRKETKMIAYELASNSWTHIPNGSDWAAPGRSGHVYGNNAYNQQDQEFYHLATSSNQVFAYSLKGESWRKLPNNKLRKDGIATAIEYFPEMGGLVKIHRNRINFFDQATQEWSDMGVLEESGYHSLMRYNPARQEVLIAGGTADPRRVYALDKNGNLNRLNDLPIDVSIRSDKLFVHPETGNYLFFTETELYEFNPYTAIVQKVEDYTNPHTRYELPFGVTIEKYGVIMFVGEKVRLYKPNL